MSYDFSVKVMSECDVFNANYTSNCSGVWHKSFEATGGQGHFADALQSKTAKEAGDLLGVMLDWIDTQPPEWVASHNAENGWGFGDGAVDVIRRLRVACLENPAGRVSIWR